jgi:hypothetical protein
MIGKRKVKKKFLIDQAIVNSIGAAFQHACVYVKGLKDNDDRKDDLRKALAENLRSLGPTYGRGVTEEEHCQNIINLADTLTKEHKDSGVLRDGRFRIGIAQKALNLYLKYLWCLGDIQTPPHCPIDRRIIDKLDLNWKDRGKYDWTKLDDIERYRTLTHKCREKARDNSLAEWELEGWTF